MADDSAPSDAAVARGATGPVACAPCRGTGTVISNLGGARREVRCPWCEGTGTWKAFDHDAQEGPRAPE